MTGGWTPNESTQASIEELFTTLLARLPYLIGVDELIPGCEITNVDTDGVGVGVIPRYISVRINRYIQAVYFRGGMTINVGDLVNVVHFREGDIYEVLTPGGPSGQWTVGGGGGAPTNAQYVVMALDATLTQERVLTGSANEIIVTDGGAGGNVTLTAGSLIVQTDQVNTFSVGPQTIQTGAAANIGLIIELDASQSVDAYQVKDSGGNPLSGADERGVIYSDADSDYRNFFAGDDAGRAAATGYGDVAIGYRAGDALTDGFGDVLIGMYAGSALTGGDHDVYIGYYSGQSATSATYCVGVGSWSIRYNETGTDNVGVGFQALEGSGVPANVSYCTAVGSGALANVQTGAEEDTALGYSAGGLLTTGDRDIFIGANCGFRQTTANDVLLIDNRLRADAATELTHAIIYGVMAANPEGQALTFNVDALTIGTDADSDVVVTFAANTNSGVLRWMEDEDLFEIDDQVDFQNRVSFDNYITVTALGPTDNLDVADVNIVYIDTTSNDVTIGGFINGVAGQVLFIAVIDNTEDATLEHAEGTGNQDIYLYNQGDQTLTRDYGGWVLVCDGSNWYQVGGAGSAW